MLMDEGWTLSEIDHMDFLYYLDLLIYKSHKKQPMTTIDQVF